MKGKTFIERTDQHQKEYFEKKFSFEKGQYHQCIPNPCKPDQRITVQLVERVLEESLKKEKTSMVDQFFSANQSTKARNVPISQVYERYNLVSPHEANKSKNDGEGEDEDES